jgi:DNA-binding NtrC family response regulator
VFFPVHHGPLDTFQRADLSTFHGEGEVIFVDDERGLMELGGRRLQILGFTPAVFSGGLEALKAFQTEPHRYCMIITDYQMPQISGLDFIRKIREISPTVPIMLCSGQFSDSLAMESLASLKVSQLLLKPFSMRDFSSAIKKALSSKV